MGFVMTTETVILHYFFSSLEQKLRRSKRMSIEVDIDLTKILFSVLIDTVALGKRKYI